VPAQGGHFPSSKEEKQGESLVKAGKNRHRRKRPKEAFLRSYQGRGRLPFFCKKWEEVNWCVKAIPLGGKEFYGLITGKLAQGGGGVCRVDKKEDSQKKTSARRKG